jgi:spoIIIJ-associated protein
MAERSQEEVLRDLLEHVVEGLGLEATVQVDSNDECLTGTLHGEDLGIFIGRHGQTIDAVQHLAQRILLADPEVERRRIVVDAEGYRARRREALEKQADQAAIEAEKYGRAVRPGRDDGQRAQAHPRVSARARWAWTRTARATSPSEHLVVTPLARRPGARSSHAVHEKRPPEPRRAFCVAWASTRRSGA